MEALTAKFMASTHAPGVAVAVVEDGRYVWGQGFGLADLENGVAATEHTLFRLGSISKPLTATAAMALWERGVLDLDAPIQKYCPSFPARPSPITTRQLLGHLGGIRHYKLDQNDPEFESTRHFDDPIAAGIAFFVNDALVAEPGAHFHYSTQGYTLAGCVLEGATGKRYADLVPATVFVPAGMEHSRTDNRFAIVPQRTRFYRKKKGAGAGEVENADFLDSSYKIPGGGWLSSAEDMARFEVAILNEALLKPATRDVMWTIQKPSDGARNTYALGWVVSLVDGLPGLTYAHSGSQQGTSTYFLVDPTRRAGVVVLANMEGVDTYLLAESLYTVLVGGVQPTGTLPVDAAALPAARAWLALLDAGQYDATWAEASARFKKAVDAKSWEANARAARARVGAIRSRVVASQLASRSLPGAPEGEYVRFLFGASAEGKAEVMEGVTLTREPDGTWRVSGYHAR